MVIEIKVKKHKKNLDGKSIQWQEHTRTIINKKATNGSNNKSSLSSFQKKSINNYYHLSNNPNLKLDLKFQNYGQEFGEGLYITKDINDWNKSLQGRMYIYEIDMSKLRIINEKDMPSNREMIKYLMSIGYDSNKINKSKPKGDTFNRRKIDIAVKREWAKNKGYNGIKPYKDRLEGEQIVIFNIPNNINIINGMRKLK